MLEVVIVFAAAVACAIAIAVLRPRYGYAAVAGTIFLTGYALFPRSITDVISAPDGTASDIAPAALRISTQVLVTIAAVLIIGFGDKNYKLPLSLVAFIVFVSLGMLFVWDKTTPQWSGYVTFVCAALAYGVGSGVGSAAFNSVPIARLILTVALGALIINAGVAVLQLAGLDLPGWLVASDRTLEQTVGRISGTIGHPANLSKVTFILTLIALPFTVADDRVLRRLAFAVTILATLIGGLSVSRANLIGTFILLTLWILTFPGRARVGTRLAGGVAIASAAVVFAPLVLERFANDSEGGLRPLLLNAGLRQLQSNLWLGTGPNSYIAVVGRFDEATASGYPVHNVFLLMTAELGLVPAICFFTTLAAALFWGLSRFTKSAQYHYVPRLIVYATPGIALIFTTGWGMISSILIGLWMFAVGFLSAAKNTTSGKNVLDTATSMHLSNERLVRFKR